MAENRNAGLSESTRWGEGRKKDEGKGERGKGGESRVSILRA